MTYTKTALLSYLLGSQTRAHFCGRVAVVLFAEWWLRRNESQRLPETVCTNVPNHGTEQTAICLYYHGGGVNLRRINFVGFVNWRSICQRRYRSVGLWMKQFFNFRWWLIPHLRHISRIFQWLFPVYLSPRERLETPPPWFRRGEKFVVAVSRPKLLPFYFNTWFHVKLSRLQCHRDYLQCLNSKLLWKGLTRSWRNYLLSSFIIKPYWSDYIKKMKIEGYY